MIRVFVIEDHPWIIDGLKYEFRPSRDEIDISGSAATIEEVLDQLKAGDFDLFILDLWLGGSDPLSNVKKLKENFPDKPIVIFTSEESPFWKERMLDAGVKAYLIKNADKKELKTTLERVARGEKVFPGIPYWPENLSGKTHEVPQTVILKPSEKEIFLLLSQGKTQKEIAELQHKTLSTIEKIVRKVKKQYHLNSTSEVIHHLTILKEI